MLFCRLNPGELAAYSVGERPFFGYRGQRLHDMASLALEELGTGNIASMTAVHGRAGSVINRIKGVRSQCRHSV
jgi:hypothetical protein